MSEKKTKKLQAFKEDAIIKIEIHSYFYMRIKALFEYFHSGLDPEKTMEMIERLKTEPPQTEQEEHLLTMISLIYAIEEEANKQGQTEMIDVEIPQP